MIWPPQNTGYFDTQRCVCCNPPAAQCLCVLRIPSRDTTFADYASAVDALANFLATTYDFNLDDYTVEKLAYIGEMTDSSEIVSANFNFFDNEFSLAAKRNCSGGQKKLSMSISINVPVDGMTLWLYQGFGITNGTTGDVTSTYKLVSCDGQVIYTGSEVDHFVVSGSGVHTGGHNFGPITFATAGEYTLTVTVEGLPACAAIDMEWDGEASETIPSYNPVVALWNDGGTTRQLWAYPKMLLPPLTEISGDWYADCTSAKDEQDNQSGDDIGYISEPPSESDSQDVSASGGSSLTLAGTQVRTMPAGNLHQMTLWASINLLAGADITLDTDASMTAVDPTTIGELEITADILDLEGNVVATGGLSDGAFGSLSSNSDSSDMGAAIAYNGRYIVRILVQWTKEVPIVGSSQSTLVTSFVIASDLTMTVNKIQSLYDIGLMCPARLESGDDCPA